MSLIVSIYTAILFFILTPAIIVRLPPGANKWTVAAVHSIVFAIIFHFTHKIVWRMGARLEGMATASPSPSATIRKNTSEPKV